MKHLGKPILLATVLVAPGATLAMSDADNACIDALRATGTPDAQGGQILESSFSEAGTLVMMKDAGGTTWRCIAYKDGAIGELTAVDAMDDGNGAMASASEDVLTAPNTERRVQFDPGTTGTSLTANLGSGAAMTYILGAAEGQFLNVSMQASAPNTYFMITVPGGDILYESAQAGNSYRGQLYLSGDHLVNVFYNGDPGTNSATVLDISIE
ncbi:hypothetical protein R3X27_12395 [Tropicimonas sp. TH_r6]|uniref:hypothetical protein n=1 Tax=Tropicimonas sp. TH_r6 TaxID=3082085 RepID=UPI0029544A8F|nr:hypothetical protein [Tropicimonas sp. TH_r6]MDV7143480.1 hypothetical protein [Tropicimonas sp. TH_r6]